MLVFIAIILISPVLIAAPLNDAQLCQAAIATNNGHSARAVKVLSSQDGIVEVSYPVSYTHLTLPTICSV